MARGIDAGARGHSTLLLLADFLGLLKERNGLAKLPAVLGIVLTIWG